MLKTGFRPFFSVSEALCLGVLLAACSSHSSAGDGTAGSTQAMGGVSAGSGGTAYSSAGTSGTPTEQEGGKPSRGGTSSDAGTSGDAGEGDAGEGGAPSAIPDLATIMAEYHSYQPQTDKPEPVSAYIFGLCRLPTLPVQAFAESEHGDGRYLQDWANALAVEGITRRGAPAFAPGSIIVKEKYVPGATSGEFDLAALGFMIKREPGFAPAHQDWDYAYWEPQLGVIATAEQSTYCAGCHVSASETDSVFVDGLVP